ncbi:MAG: rod shape-determining protein MreC [Flavobacteriales bacterium]
MKNFILLIRKYNFFILFLMLQVVSIYLLVQNNSYQRTSFVNTSNFYVGKIYEYYAMFTDYLKLSYNNRILAEENARLLNQMSFAKYDLDSTQTKIIDSLYKQQYVFVEARIINNSTNKINNYITLNKGGIHGIDRDMAVISSDGVVGIVKDVSDHFSSVISILNSQIKISSKIKKNNYFGSLVWDGKSSQYCNLMDIPIHAPVEVGDTIITSEHSNIFPQGIMVGTVSETSTAGQSFKLIRVKLSVNFDNITNVYVVRDLMKEERKKLEMSTQNDK